MRVTALIAGLAALATLAAAETPPLESILSQVAVNQAKSRDLRTQYTYNQKQLLRLLRGNHKLAREERREYSVTPAIRAVKKHLTHLEGKYETHGRLVNYDRPGFRYKGADLDGALVDAFSNELMDDRDSRDGISKDLFPLTYHQQLKYDFRLAATESYRGRPVYRLTFLPKPEFRKLGQGAAWKGEALIDAEEFQPIRVTTDMAAKLPTAVKILLGTDIKGLGFTVTYRRFPDGVWFPVTFGGEFVIRGLFLYHRTMAFSLVNSDFRKADVESNIAYAKEEQ